MTMTVYQRAQNWIAAGIVISAMFGGLAYDAGDRDTARFWTWVFVALTVVGLITIWLENQPCGNGCCGNSTRKPREIVERSIDLHKPRNGVDCVP